MHETRCTMAVLLLLGLLVAQQAEGCAFARRLLSENPAAVAATSAEASATEGPVLQLPPTNTPSNSSGEAVRRIMGEIGAPALDVSCSTTDASYHDTDLVDASESDPLNVWSIHGNENRDEVQKWSGSGETFNKVGFKGTWVAVGALHGVFAVGRFDKNLYWWNNGRFELTSSPGNIRSVSVGRWIWVVTWRNTVHYQTCRTCGWTTVNTWLGTVDANDDGEVYGVQCTVALGLIEGYAPAKLKYTPGRTLYFNGKDFLPFGSKNMVQVSAGPQGLWGSDFSFYYFWTGQDWKQKGSRSGGYVTSGKAAMWISRRDMDLRKCIVSPICEAADKGRATYPVGPAPYTDKQRLCFFNAAKYFINLYFKDKAADFLRLAFHDCGPGGCDASILFNNEKDHPNNFKIEALSDIIKLQSQIKGRCLLDRINPSYADTIQVAAAVSVAMVGGPDLTSNYAFRLGRGDRTAYNDPARLPTANMNVGALISNFKSIFGITNDADAAKLLVLLSGGGHTIGDAHCFHFNDRRAQGAQFVEADFQARLKFKCPAPALACVKAELDDGTPNVFDNSYFKILQQRRGLLFSDQTLFDGGNVFVKTLVDTYANNGALFMTDYTTAFIRMSSMNTTVFG